MRGASLELRAGEFVSIVGRSGSGKSTLMAMLGALTKPTDGKVLLDGTDIWALSEAELARFRSRHIGFIFQFPSLLSNLTAVDNVAVPALLGRTMDARTGLRARLRSPRPRRTGGPRRRLSGQHVGRRAAPRGGRPRADQLAAPVAGRRADQRPRRGHRSRHHRPARAAAADRVRSAWRSSPTISSSPGARSAPTRCGKARSAPIRPAGASRSRPSAPGQPALRADRRFMSRPQLTGRRRGARADSAGQQTCWPACRPFC